MSLLRKSLGKTKRFLHYALNRSFLFFDPLQNRKNYLDLLEACLTGLIYEDAPLTEQHYMAEKRHEGLDWPGQAHSMIGTKRIKNIRLLLEDIIFKNIPGDVIETGVWRGGACIYMRGILKAYNQKLRRVLVADSFEGLPPPNPNEYPADTGDILHTYRELSVPLEQVMANFRKYGLLDEQVVFLKGWFKDTLPSAPTRTLALIRLDGDMYESTIQALENLYPKLSKGGYVIVDDYHMIEACSKAVTDFRNKFSIHSPLIDIDSVGVYWQKI